jgi:hypothetical protein
VIYRIYADRDTTITNAKDSFSGVPHTGSNLGGSETLETFKLAGVSGASGYAASSSLSRVLISFDLARFTELTASRELPGMPQQSRLVMRHCTANAPIPSSFDMLVQPVSSSWDEGAGIDFDRLQDAGFANWVMRTSTQPWTTQGGDLLTASLVHHFDTGLEDLDADAGQFMSAWLAGAYQNNGLAVRVTSSLELDSVYRDYYTKRFYGRTSRFLDRRPFIELRWDDSLRDDRGRMAWGVSGTLVFYNAVDGQLSDLSAPPVLRVADSANSLLAVTASYAGQVGIYSASFVLNSGSAYSGSVFYDLWSLSGSALLTGSFTLADRPRVTTLRPNSYWAAVRGIKSEYDVSEAPRLDVLFRPRGFQPSTVRTASLDPSKVIVRKAYYAIENDATRERVVEFSTGALEYTRLSYDSEGNYFRFHMSNLQPGNLYRLLFMVDENGTRQVIDQDVKFKVV